MNKFIKTENKWVKAQEIISFDIIHYDINTPTTYTLSQFVTEHNIAQGYLVRVLLIHHDEYIPIEIYKSKSEAERMANNLSKQLEMNR